MRALLATATAVLLLAGLSACADDDPKPKIEASTDSPDPSTSPATVNPPTSAPPAPETPSAFLRRWQNANAAMQLTGETASFRALTWDCRSCDQLADRVDEIYRDGGSITQADYQMTNLHQVGRSGDVHVFEYNLVSGRSKVFDSRGHVLQSFAGGTEHFQINVTKRHKNNWAVVRVSEIVA